MKHVAHIGPHAHVYRLSRTYDSHFSVTDETYLADRFRKAALQVTHRSEPDFQVLSQPNLADHVSVVTL